MITQDLIINDNKYDALKMRIKQMLKDAKLLSTFLNNKTEKKTARKIIVIINDKLLHLMIKNNQAK